MKVESLITNFSIFVSSIISKITLKIGLLLYELDRRNEEEYERAWEDIFASDLTNDPL